MIKRILIGIIGLFLLSPNCWSETVGGIDLPDTLTVGESHLILNGAGLRKKLFMKIYAGGLYLSQKQSDSQKIMDADEPMAIRMHFIYDGVSSDKLIEAWNEGFKNATGGEASAIQEKIDRFNGFFTQEAQKNDVYDIVYLPQQGITVTVKGKRMGTIPGLAFKKAVFGIWLGEETAVPKLKKAMLGN